MRDGGDIGRHRPVHHAPVEQGSRTIIVFVTVCSQTRRPLLANPAAMELIVAAWRKADLWLVGKFVILPDHIHFFCAPAALPAHPLVKWMSFWRNAVTRSWPTREDVPIWQTDFWDRQLRRDESYAAKWEYVRNNPVRHGLAARAEDWPYHGELNVLDWHDA